MDMRDDLVNTEACTLPTVERPLRLAELRGLFADHLTHLSWAGGRLQLSLAGDAGLRDRVADLTRRESECCSFFEFGLTGSDQALLLEIAVRPEHREILDGVASLADGARR